MRESYRLLLKDNDIGNANHFMSLIFVGSDKALGKTFAEMKNITKKLLEGIKC